MNIQALLPSSSGGAGPSGGVAAAGLASDMASALTFLASTPNLSASQRQGLSQALAMVAKNVATPSLRANLVEQINGVGIFLAAQSSDGFPAWEVMTALRAYGLNLKRTPQVVEEAAAQLVQQKLAELTAPVAQSVAQNGVSSKPVPAASGRTSSLPQSAPSAPQKQPAAPVSDTPARVDLIA